MARYLDETEARAGSWSWRIAAVLAVIPLLLASFVLAATGDYRWLGVVGGIVIGLVCVAAAYLVILAIAGLWRHRPRYWPLYVVALVSIGGLGFMLWTSARILVPLKVPLVGGGSITISGYAAVVQRDPKAPDKFRLKEQITVQMPTGVQPLEQETTVSSGSSGFALRAVTFRPWKVNSHGVVSLKLGGSGPVRVKLCPVTCPQAAITVEGIPRNEFFAAGGNTVTISGSSETWNPPDIDQGVRFQYIPSADVRWRGIIYHFVGISSVTDFLAVMATSIYTFLVSSLLIPIWLSLKPSILAALEARALKVFAHLHSAHAETNKSGQEGGGDHRGGTSKEVSNGDSATRARDNGAGLRSSLHDAAELSNALAALVWPIVLFGLARIFHRNLADDDNKRDGS